MLRTSLLLQNLVKEITVITCDIVLALCTSSDGHLSMYQVSFNSLLYFQRYAPVKLFIAKIKKGSLFVLRFYGPVNRMGSCVRRQFT